MTDRNNEDPAKHPALGLLALGHTGWDLWKKRTPSTPAQRSSKRRTLIIGWDAADWKLVNAFRKKGIMPTLDRMIQTGVSGKIATLDPPFSPMLWTSIATGKTADKHGILGFFEKHGDSGRPIHGSSRTARTFWNLFTHEQIPTQVVNWWPSHPAEQIHGSMLSNLTFKGKTNTKGALLIPRTGIHPESHYDALKRYFVLPEELTSEQLQHFFPDVTEELAKAEEKGVHRFRELFAKCLSIHNTATWLMEQQDWEVMAVYQEAIDHAGHGFMKFFPPKLPNIPDEKFQMYHYIMEGMYRFHDMMLERLLKLAGPDTDVILLSDHGFHSDHLRPTRLPKMDAGPALEHAPFGILVCNGPSFRQGEQVHGASLLDITPTLLHLKNLPVGRDMQGKVLLQIFREERAINYIDSWETMKGDFGESRLGHDAAANEVDDDTLVQLIELGYVDADAKNLKGLNHKAELHQMYNLARVYLNKNEVSRAVFILHDLIEKEPKDLRFNLSLISAYLALGHIQEARLWLNRFKAGKPDPFANLLLLEARILQEEKSYFTALEVLKRAQITFAKNPNIALEMGFGHLQLRQYEQARSAFDDALKLDPENARAWIGKATAFLREGNTEPAVECALNSIDLVYNAPKAHAILGEAFVEMGLYEEASRAYENCLHMAPHFRAVRGQLINLYREQLNNPDRATHHGAFLDRPEASLTLVSGLPRSGTSMMMQMLAAGGLDILADGEREADESNPKGYYEYEPVKRLAEDVSWLPEADGKTVKIVAPLLRYLPRNLSYRVIFMERNLNEVVRSQQIMLGKDPNQLPLALLNSYEQQLRNLDLWNNLQPHARVLRLNYPEVIAKPMEAARKVAEFLEKPLDVEAMATVVDPALHRTR